MIGYLKGKVKYLSPDFVLLEVNGVGYEIICSGAAFSKLSGASEGEIYTYLQVKEDGVSLFGFADMQEKGLFLKLTSVQGVGAKMAISLLSSMRPSDISEAIALSDKVVVLSARPARVVAEHKIEFGDGSPKKRRECPEFSQTFEVLRKELGI